jgi:hypothetical protein
MNWRFSIKKGNFPGILPQGFPAENMESHNSPIMRFIRSLGLYCDPATFEPAELEGMNVRIVINNVCNSNPGLHSIVTNIFPAERAA